ncbi:FadR/GntR family transcriptional regulator [Corynebacterium spheniscorum]|uniref:DNA-binding transcriptional regulator, FadR family n=1 Tax=Corynebacterium spheniscorum TaxID=185761 RepID=A0A1I2TA81_9CORY|nr:FCD domain-containing protein [Corynebacterium spheniscorum]SFG60999.1 DNA-binding transcriptional regulator, FadR family [Corynebacterium spheniscorum]
MSLAPLPPEKGKTVSDALESDSLARPPLPVDALFPSRLPGEMGSSAAGRAAEGIIDFIRRQKLESGDCLPSEPELCEQLECSRSSLREAVRTLGSLDIVEVRHGHGTFVGKMSLDPLVQGLVLRISLSVERSLNGLLEVMEMREAIDQMVASALMEGWRDMDFSRLEALVHQMDRKYRAGESFADEDRAFHRELLSVVDNELMRELSDAFWQVHMAVLPLLGIGYPEDIQLTIDSHAGILRAVAAEDLEAYRKVVSMHYEPLRRVVGRRLHGESPHYPPNSRY